MAKSDNLRKAKQEQNDEFYTQLVDIENELKHYKEHFNDKIVFCNCDDPFESNFFKYFATNFNYLGLKKLVCTCYDNSPVAYTQLSFFGVNENKSILNNNRKAYKIEINEVKDENNDGAVDLADVKLLLQNKKNTLTYLKGNGDFRSEECIVLLKESDIVVTNPPFSVLREFVAQLIENKKDFLIIGNKNAIAYKEIFPLIRDNKLWLGYTSPQEYILPGGDKTKRVQGLTRWFTNLETTNRKEGLDLYKKYNEKEYPKYSNFNAINVDKVCDIPEDYFDIMGVPITFLDKYNPEQFEIIGLGNGYLGQSIGIKGIPKEHKMLMKGHSAAGDLYYMKNGLPIVPYNRIIIRRKKNEN